jgi:hypothetical protein
VRWDCSSAKKQESPRVRTIGRISQDPITQVGGVPAGSAFDAGRPGGPSLQFLQRPENPELPRLLLALTTDTRPPTAGRPPGRGTAIGPAIRSHRASDKMRLVC